MTKKSDPPVPWVEVPKGLTDDGWAAMRVGSLPWDVFVKLTYVDGAPQITSLCLEPRGTKPWTAKDGTQMSTMPPQDAVVTVERLRKLPLRLMAQLAAEVFGGDASDESLQAVFDAHRVEWPQGRQRPPEHYEAVARVYEASLNAGRPPVKAVAEHWVVGRAMASRYVKEARVRGLLGYPARPGVAGTGQQKSPIQAKKATKVTAKKERKG
jgi:hypothetical protein